MSDIGRNRNAEQRGHAGREYWSPRKPPMMEPSKHAKKATHTVERAEARRLERKLLIDVRDRTLSPEPQ